MMSLLFASSEIRRCKLLTSCQKMHHPGMFLTTRTKMGMIRESYNGIGGMNFRADAKRFTHKAKKKITSCQL